MRKHELTPCWGFSNLIFWLIQINAMCQRKLEFTVVKDSRTSVLGLMRISTDVSASKPYFTATQYRRQCASSVAEYSHPTSTVWLINKNTKESAQIWADRRRWLSKQNGLAIHINAEVTAQIWTDPLLRIQDHHFLAHSYQYQCVISNRRGAGRCQRLTNLDFWANSYQYQRVSV